VYTRLSAVFLLIFSGFWPHIKLFILHLYYYLKMSSLSRSSAFYYLSSFGKLSLADVCVICFLIAILNVTYYMDAGTVFQESKEVLQGMLDEFGNATLPQAVGTKLETLATTGINGLVDAIFDSSNSTLHNRYNELVAQGCGKHFANTTCQATWVQPSTDNNVAGIVLSCSKYRLISKCKFCACAVNSVLYNWDNLSLVTNGLQKLESLLFARALVLAKYLISMDSLSVSGMATFSLIVTAYPAAVVFCLGVFVSISASVLVDWMDERAQVLGNKGKPGHSSPLDDEGAAKSNGWLFSKGPRSTVWKASWAALMPASLAITAAAIAVPTFDWMIKGTAPDLIVFSNQGFLRQLSLVDLTTGILKGGSGSDVALCVLFGVAVLGAPLLRAALLTIVGVAKIPNKWQYRCARLSNIIGAFVGWEPLLLCIILIQLEVPTITSTILPETLCDNLRSTFPTSWIINILNIPLDGPCFQMFFNFKPAAALLVVAWLLSVVGNNVTWETVLEYINPFRNAAYLGRYYLRCNQCCTCCECCTSYCDCGTFTTPADKAKGKEEKYL